MTIPLAFVSTTLTLLSWAVVAPVLGMVLNRWKPAGLASNDLPLVIDQGRGRFGRTRGADLPGPGDDIDPDDG